MPLGELASPVAGEIPVSAANAGHVGTEHNPLLHGGDPAGAIQNRVLFEADAAAHPVDRGRRGPGHVLPQFLLDGIAFRESYRLSGVPYRFRSANLDRK